MMRVLKVTAKVQVKANWRKNKKLKFERCRETVQNRGDGREKGGEKVGKEEGEGGEKGREGGSGKRGGVRGREGLCVWGGEEGLISSPASLPAHAAWTKGTQP